MQTVIVKALKSPPKSEPPKCQELEHPAYRPGYCHSIFTSLDRKKALKGRTFTSNDHVQDAEVQWLRKQILCQWDTPKWASIGLQSDCGNFQERPQNCEKPQLASSCLSGIPQLRYCISNVFWPSWAIIKFSIKQVEVTYT